MATVAVLFALAVLVIARWAALYGMNRAILQRQQEVARLERANQHLALEVAQRDSLARLEAAARARGYEAPDALRTVRVPEATRGRGTAAGGQAPGGGGTAAGDGQAGAVRETVVALAPAGAEGEPGEPAVGSGGTAGGPLVWLGRIWQRVFGG